MGKKENIKIRFAMIGIPVLLFLLFLVLGFGIWREYRNTLMENQKKQIQMATDILSRNMEISMAEYEDNLEFLYRIGETSEDSAGIYKKYLETQNSFISDVCLENEQGDIVKSVKGIQLSQPVFFIETEEKNSIWQMEDEDERKYLVFKKKSESGTSLCLVINQEEYYRKLISDLQVGTNGYFVIKNYDGTIIMHPDEKQWGIDVIEGRKQMFPNLDFSSLEKMVEEQNSGKEGISEYYSYWWTDPELPKVKKVSAYTPLTIGDDFWVVSAVIDYNDLYEPIQKGFARISIVFIGILVIFLTFFLMIGKLWMDKRKAAMEITDLRELNALLEEVHRSEETIAHQQRLQIMGTMTGGIAHEFNNFLTPIMGYAELLMMELPEGSEEQENAQEIYEASEKAKEVVRQISTLSRKNVETVYKSIPVQQMFRRALKMIASVCPPQIHLESEIVLSEEYILGNVTQINQVLLNICVNAVQAIHSAGQKEGRLLVRGKKTARSQMDGKLASKLSDVWKEYIQIDIEDNGSGMDQETLRQIFDPFFTTKKGGEGTGLGLALAEQIIHSHKGYIYAESEMGKGTKFHIFLPVLEHQLQSGQAEKAQEKDYRIVIADDNAKILQLLQKNFEKLGIQIATCMKMTEIQRCLEQKGADVLVVDESVEDGSGIDVIMAVAGKYPNMLKIIMTNCVTREIVEAKQKGIIDGYIEKPVSDATLLEVIRSCTKL